jgi:hypothetical protein
VTIVPARLAAGCVGLDDQRRWGKMAFETAIGGSMSVSACRRVPRRGACVSVLSSVWEEPMRIGIFYDIRNPRRWFKPFPQFYAETLDHMQAGRFGIRGHQRH